SKPRTVPPSCSSRAAITCTGSMNGWSRPTAIDCASASASWNLLVSLSMRMKARSSFDQMVSGFRCLMTWGYTRGYQPGKAVRHRLPASAVDPDERGHAPAGRLAAMGEEARGIGVRARPAAVDRGASRAREALPRKRIEVGLPAAARVSHERVGRLEARGREGRADLVADLERPRPDRGTEPREDLRW